MTQRFENCELLMQMTTQFHFDFGLDTNCQTRIFFIFYPLTLSIHEIRFINKPSHSGSFEHY